MEFHYHCFLNKHSQGKKILFLYTATSLKIFFIRRSFVKLLLLSNSMQYDEDLQIVLLIISFDNQFIIHNHHSYDGKKNKI
ncbi:hypothetical protein DERF_014903 [Dermatophagoides farinae]|uniref:Uncharacterized protein n=1 Tax=Dermatophagoides farinae TaxID=6954 RepID=A0A922HN87_DERFA|nr:hypothetical protein DERF_014903 [Dermatophagoides farinae]